MTPEQHRERALALLDDVSKTTVGSPARMAWLAEAQVHALLAISAPSAPDRAVTLAALARAGVPADTLAALAQAEEILPAEPEQIEEPRPTPPPSKPTTRKTAPKKETRS